MQQMPSSKIQRTPPKFTDRQLWEKYWNLTRELLKFIKAEDIDTFVNLVDQRYRLMQRMEEMPEEERDFRYTQECADLKQKIIPIDKEVMYRARTWLNKSRQNNAQVTSYGAGAMLQHVTTFNRQL